MSKKSISINDEEQELFVDEEIDTGLPVEQEEQSDLDDFKPFTSEKITFRCKPTYNFQSIEFEYTCDIDHIDEMMVLYDALVKEMMKIAPEQPSKQVILPKDLATEKQRKIMDQFHIKYSSTTTRQEAQQLIQKSIDAVNGK